MNFASTMNFGYGHQILIDVSEYMKMVDELAMLRKEKAALTESNQNKDEIILSLKNESSSLLRNHIRVIVEKREVVREKDDLEEKLNVIEGQLKENVEENEMIKGELENTRAQYEEEQKKTNELTITAEELSKEQENNVEMLKNAKVELEEKESELLRREWKIVRLKDWTRRELKQNKDLYLELYESKRRNKTLFEENISFGKEIGRMKKAGCLKRLLKKW